MLYCAYCDRRFFDGELVTFRNLSGTHIAHHTECFETWRRSEEELCRLFSQEFDAGSIETFERPFYDSQIVADAG
jgi:hypothetical protein